LHFQKEYNDIITSIKDVENYLFGNNDYTIFDTNKFAKLID